MRDYQTFKTLFLSRTQVNKYITQARKMIVSRGEVGNPGKITAELTIGFWITRGFTASNGLA